VHLPRSARAGRSNPSGAVECRGAKTETIGDAPAIASGLATATGAIDQAITGAGGQRATTAWLAAS